MGVPRASGIRGPSPLNAISSISQGLSCTVMCHVLVSLLELPSLTDWTIRKCYSYRSNGWLLLISQIWPNSSTNLYPEEHGSSSKWTVLMPRVLLLTSAARNLCLCQSPSLGHCQAQAFMTRTSSLGCGGQVLLRLCPVPFTFIYYRSPCSF